MLAWCLYFNTWPLCFYKEGSVFRHVSASCLWNVYCSILVEKSDISGYIWPRSFKQTVKCSLLDEKIVYQSFLDAPLMFSSFSLQGKVLCFARVGKSLARCLLSKGFRSPCRKSYISSYIWHKSFIQTVKSSFFKQIIVNQSFYVCCVKMGLKRVSPVPFDKKQ